MFRVGMKVQYIHKKLHAYDQTTPEPGAVYTIRHIGTVPNELGKTEEAVLLHEINNAPFHWRNGFYELHMNARFFRPVVSRPTSIAIFTAMLNPTKRKVRA